MRFQTAIRRSSEELRQITYVYSTFLSRVITGDERWIYGYDPETKQQSSQWKMKIKVKSMFTIFFYIKAIFHKEFVLAGQTVNSAYYGEFWRLKKTKTKLHGLSPRANYTDRATAACRRSDCQLVRIEGATWSA
jgi:hypothetical protein